MADDTTISARQLANVDGEINPTSYPSGTPSIDYSQIGVIDSDSEGEDYLE